MIYIATHETPGVVQHITCYENRTDLMLYADAVTESYTDTDVGTRDTIDTICHKLRDLGVGHGSRIHYRISRREAELLVRGGVRGFGLPF